MKLARLNLLTSLVSLGLACLWIAIGQGFAGVVWFVCSLVWLALGIAYSRSAATEPHPMARLARRLSRLLLWS